MKNIQKALLLFAAFQLVMLSGTFAQLDFKVSGSTKMTITTDGNVGVGTTTTGGHKLAVEGSIGAREVVVETTTWADFVFAPEYELPTLQEVENYIKINGHLCDIPSEAEVKANGISLAEMDAKLLQKIEELTLYTIEQEKKIEAQKKEIEEMKKQLELLMEKLK